ncbi:hypothetical protein [Hyalangium sp.]|uniref:hypothetical protein n=1 Tax=Hyalangium sp. TaxID=2028555 RepID=UPI002D64E9CB|nr:hypothetical protein [Hyalangium sp.]HYI02535.1 hypothetical protein [Hyalangium sp.]
MSALLEDLLLAVLLLLEDGFLSALLSDVRDDSEPLGELLLREELELRSEEEEDDDEEEEEDDDEEEELRLELELELLVDPTPMGSTS